jgi:hypothetical protein
MPNTQVKAVGSLADRIATRSPGRTPRAARAAAIRRLSSCTSAYERLCPPVVRQGAPASSDKTLEEMIWRVVSRYAELAGRPAALEPPVAYGMLDGLFQQALLAYVSGHTEVLAALASHVRTVLPLMLAR